MPTFRFNSEHPYYQDGRLMKKVTTQHNIRLSSADCAVLGFNVARLLGRLTLALIFKRNPYRPRWSLVLWQIITVRIFSPPI